VGIQGTITFEEYWSNSAGVLLVDARSPSEFAHAHIPGAVNIPLLDDEQRKVVGTLYKQEGRQKAVLEGFRIAGPDFHMKAEKAIQILTEKKLDGTKVYCWRGGMRSDILQWIIQLSGIPSQKLSHGYKFYRRSVLEHLSVEFDLRVLGGKTGSGKTSLLNDLAAHGEQVVDLEKLANHKGSAFGGLGKEGQPSNEMFENLLFEELRKLDTDKPVWVENESRSIGRAMIPKDLFDQMRKASVIEIDPGYDSRFNRIKEEYGSFSVDLLADSTTRIIKRLGPNNMKKALDHLNSGNFDEWLKIVLSYYDKLYEHSSSQRDPSTVKKVRIDPNNSSKSVELILNKAYSI
jgi:tRNA 2-selenouridine synthase